MGSHDTLGNKIKSPHEHSFQVGIYMSRLWKIDIVFPWNWCFTVYDIDNTFKFQALQALQTEGERNCPVRFCSKQLPQSFAVILHLLIFYNTRTNMHIRDFILLHEHYFLLCPS